MSATIRNLAEISSDSFMQGELVGSTSTYGANSMVCRHFHSTAHHTFSTELILVPVMRYLMIMDVFKT